MGELTSLAGRAALVTGGEPGHRPGDRRRAARPGCGRDDHRAQAGRAGGCGGRAGRRTGRRRHGPGARRRPATPGIRPRGPRPSTPPSRRSAGSRSWSTTPGSTRSSVRSSTPTSTPSARSSTSTWWRRWGSCSSRTGRGWARTAGAVVNVASVAGLRSTARHRRLRGGQGRADPADRGAGVAARAGDPGQRRGARRRPDPVLDGALHRPRGAGGGRVPAGQAGDAGGRRRRWSGSSCRTRRRGSRARRCGWTAGCSRPAGWADSRRGIGGPRPRRPGRGGRPRRARPGAARGRRGPAARPGRAARRGGGRRAGRRARRCRRRARPRPACPRPGAGPGRRRRPRRRERPRPGCRGAGRTDPDDEPPLRLRPCTSRAPVVDASTTPPTATPTL